MTQPSKLAVQYLLNDEPSAELSKKTQHSNQHRDHHRHYQQVVGTQHNSSASSTRGGGGQGHVGHKNGSGSDNDARRNHGKHASATNLGGHGNEPLNDSLSRRSRKLSSAASASPLSPDIATNCHNQSMPALPTSSLHGTASTESHPVLPILTPKPPHLNSSNASGSPSKLLTSSSAAIYQHMLSSTSSSSMAVQSSRVLIPSSSRMARRQAERNQRTPQDRQFKCEVCGKFFVERGNLNKHVSSVHLKEKPKVCTEPGCDKSFSFRDGLMRHIAHVHQNQRFHVCMICQKSFKQASHLAKHMRTIHKQIQ